MAVKRPIMREDVLKKRSRREDIYSSIKSAKSLVEIKKIIEALAEEVLGKKLFILIGFIMGCSTVSMAFEDNIGQLMDSIRRPVSAYQSEYRGQVDRYDSAQFQNDPEVLVSVPPLRMSIKPMKEPVERIVYVERVPEEDIVVTTSFTCDTEREDCDGSEQ